MSKPYPSQQKRRAVMVDDEYRDQLNAAATRDGITAKEATEALITLYASGQVEIVKIVKAVVATRQSNKPLGVDGQPSQPTQG